MINMTPKRFAQRGIILVLVMLLSVILMPTPVLATPESDEFQISVLAAGQTLDGPGFFAGTIVRVDGNVEGTAFAAGQDVTINGHIEGDLFAAARTLVINGTVSGNIYCAGQYLTLKSQNSGDVFAAGQDLTLAEEAMIGRDLFSAGSTTLLAGSVARDFKGGGDAIAIGGSVGRDVGLDAAKISVLDAAVIKGDLAYKSEQEAAIGSGSQIGGQTHWQYVDRTPEKHPDSPWMKLCFKLLGMAGALLLWFLIRVWKPDVWQNTAAKISEKPLKTLGIGAIALIAAPLAVIILLITVIGIPVGVLLGLAYGVSLYLSKIIVAVWIGSWLARRFGWPEIHKGLWLFLLGLVILTVLGMIPVLKVLVGLAVVLFGLGAVVSVNHKTKVLKTDPPPTNDAIREIQI